jgi:hypothetical protein
MVLAVVYLKAGQNSADSASVLVPIKDLKSKAFPSWIFQAVLVHGFLIFDLLYHGFSFLVLSTLISFGPCSFSHWKKLCFWLSHGPRV